MTTDTNTYATIAGLNSGSDYLVLSADSSGTKLELYNTIGNSTTGPSITVGTPFFWAVACSGTSAAAYLGYMRNVSANALTAWTYSGRSFTPTQLWIANDAFTEPFNGRVWNVKCWDRVLTADELLVESFYAGLKFPGSINFWWPLATHTDLNDYSGNARGATAGGTLTTEDTAWQSWKPGAMIYSLAASSGAPNLTAASAINIGATQATPRVTFTR